MLHYDDAAGVLCHAHFTANASRHKNGLLADIFHVSLWRFLSLLWRHRLRYPQVTQPGSRHDLCVTFENKRLTCFVKNGNFGL